MLLTEKIIKKLNELNTNKSKTEIKTLTNNYIEDLKKSRKFSNYILNDKNLMIRYKIHELQNLRKLISNKDIKSQISWQLASLKENINYDTKLLDFNSFYELDLFKYNDVNIFTGLDIYIMYLLKWIKSYNFKNYCNTYQVSINDLRSQVNLKLMTTYLNDYLKQIKNLNVKSFLELKKREEIDIIKYWVRSKLRIILRDYTTLLSLPIYLPNNKLTQYRQLKKMNTANNVQRYISLKNANNKQSNIVKIYTNKHWIREIKIKIDLKKLANYRNKKIDLKLIFKTNYKIETKNYDSNYDYYDHIIKRVLKNVDLKNLTLQACKPYVLNLEIILNNHNLLLLKQLYFDNMQIRELLKFYQCKHATLKTYIESQLNELKQIIENRLNLIKYYD